MRHVRVTNAYTEVALDLLPETPDRVLVLIVEHGDDAIELFGHRVRMYHVATGP